jgi:hypothetical protein
MTRTPLQAAIGAIMDEGANLKKYVADLEAGRSIEYATGKPFTVKQQAELLPRLKELKAENDAAFKFLWDLHESRAATGAESAKPVDMVLYCPNCGTQHVDAPEEHEVDRGLSTDLVVTWTNPPHRSHLCHACETIWRPADVSTNGVERIKTAGKDDTWRNGSVAIDAELTSVATKDAVLSDTGMMNWLCEHTVNVRLPLVYGSRDMFWASPTDDDGGHTPSNLRVQIAKAQCAVTKVEGQS